MKPDGIEAAIGPVVGIPRKSRDRARIAVVGAIAFVVIAAGVGLAGNGLTAPEPSPSPSPTDGVAVSSSSPIPSASPGKLPQPTQNTGLGCSPVRRGAPPEIQLGPFGPSKVGAIRGAPATAGIGGGSPAPSWPTLPQAGALRLPANASITVFAEQDACMRYVVAEYLPGAPGVTLPFPIAFRTMNISPPRSIQPLGTLPSGDWIVRVVAYFSTGSSGDDGGTVLERFFRVVNSATPVPIPSPLSTPAVPCAPPAPGGVAPALILTGSSAGSIEGTPGLVLPPLTPVVLGDLIEIRVAGDACAIGWTITGKQDETNFQSDFDQEANPTNNPFLYAQNRWRLHDLPTGRLTVSATVRFSADVSVSRRWFLDVGGSATPTVRISTPADTAVTAVQAPCGGSWAFTIGTSGFEYCSVDVVPNSVPVLSVGPETPLRLDAPGWTIRSWGGSCGRIDPAAVSQMLIVNGCDLGGWYGSDGGPPLPGPAMFLPRTAGPLVRIFVQAQRGDALVTVTVYATILAAP